VKETLLKVGGAELEEGPVLASLVQAIRRLSERGPLIVVHGGGPDIARLQKRLGISPTYVEGLRVTDSASLQVAEMVLSGTVNKRLTARLVNQGVQAIGLSGVDGGLLRARKLQHPKGDLGRVGEITAVNKGLLRGLLRQGLVPVISPISLGDDGYPFNVNADHVALAIGNALTVEELIFVTDVPGVMRKDRLLSRLSAREAVALIDDGVIYGGMIPKVRAALDAVQNGVGAVRITNLEGLLVGNAGTWIVS